MQLFGDLEKKGNNVLNRLISFIDIMLGFGFFLCLSMFIWILLASLNVCYVDIPHGADNIAEHDVLLFCTIC